MNSYHRYTFDYSQNTFKLIEKAAQKTALEILKNFSLLKSVDIEIRKPEAPIEMQFESVSVKIHREWHTAIIKGSGTPMNFTDTVCSIFY